MLSEAHFFHRGDRHERSAVFLCSYETGSLSDYSTLGDLGNGKTSFLRISLEGFEVEERFVSLTVAESSGRSAALIPERPSASFHLG